MDSKPARQQPATTIRVGEGGGLSMDIGPGGFGAGFSQLMDFTAPTFTAKPLATGETTKAGFVRTGDAIARALTKASAAFP